jgi:hypothetical protein
MKLLDNNVSMWALVLLCVAAYLAARNIFPTPRFHLLTGGLAVVLFAIGILLLVRFRWSAELVAVVAILWLLWAGVHIVDGGFTINKIVHSVAALMVIASYPELRRQVRGPD